MILPQLVDLNDINRILLTIRELTSNNSECHMISVIRICTSKSYSGHPINYKKIISFCMHSKFINKNGNRVSLSKLGEEFIRLNPNKYYEITERQMECFAKELLLLGPWKEKSFDLFNKFSPNHLNLTYQYSIFENGLPLKYNAIVHLCKNLGVIKLEKDILIVCEDYVRHVRELILSKVDITPETIVDQTLIDVELAEKAENDAVEIEKKRLKTLGRNASEIKLVRRISDLEPNAGYDVRSYNGVTPIYDYDRFIEVKCTEGPKLKFFWSPNQVKVAKILGDQYWIYCFINYSNENIGNVPPVIIKNPIKMIKDIPALSIKTFKFIVKQESEIDGYLIEKESPKYFELDSKIQ